MSGLTEDQRASGPTAGTAAKAIVSDIHFLVPVVVLLIGITLLVLLH